jgi:uncharacterized protein (TIGR01777 family)
MKVVVTGASGLIGTPLVARLRTEGHVVTRLVRRAPSAPDEAWWDPRSGKIDHLALEGADAVVHLAGAGVGDHRWTDAYKREILRSRVEGTDLIARSAAALDRPPRVLVCASGIDYYADTDEPVDEDGPRGDAFLADVVVAWEGAAQPARDAGITVTHARSALVLSPAGGVLARLRPLLALGLAGPIGSGRQWWSWIALPDHLRALIRLLDADLPGPVNLSSPHPERQHDLIRALARQRRRPSVMPAPTFALRVLVGQFTETIVASHRVQPRRLLDAGFTFDYPDATSAARWAMG